MTAPVVPVVVQRLRVLVACLLLVALAFSQSPGQLTADTKLAQFGVQMKTAKAPPTYPTWEQVAVKFDAQVEKVAKQNANVADALKTVQQEATSIGTGG